MTAWLLPERFSDVLPREAATIEKLRRTLLDHAESHGYELVIPPLLEFVDSLLSGTGQDLELQTFKLVDQVSGRTLGLRADMTPQAARIDAHLLNRQGIVRLCYCDSVVHTHPQGVYATRQPMQFGVECYGHAGLEADLEVQQLALHSVRLAGYAQPALGLSDARLVRGVLGGVVAGPLKLSAMLEALSRKDVARLEQLTDGLPRAQREPILALTELFGDISVLEQARRVLPARELVQRALDDLERLAAVHAQAGCEVQIDLADLRGYHYHSGVIFGLYAPDRPDALARGGRYDEIGASFGRSRPATGFSLDLRELVRAEPTLAARAAVRASWSDQPGYASAVRELRERGEVVIELPEHVPFESEGFRLDRELTCADGRWVVRERAPAT
jgi:ATP phosphoribosyltransferase regulatory subunit